jgi:hypothetical protein
MYLIGDLHPHEALAGVRQRNRYRPGIEVDNHKRIQRVAVGSNNALLDRRSKLAAMPFPEAAVLDHPGEINIGLGASSRKPRERYGVQPLSPQDKSFKPLRLEQR